MSRRELRPMIARGLACLTLVAATARASEMDETTRLDCGVNALYVLLQLEGRPTSLERLLATLPARHPDGLSMAELVETASALGLGLEGIRIGPGGSVHDRPAIAFLQGPKGGHYSVLRPVGTTGTMVQIIDPPHVPRIDDYDRVLSNKAWTGRALVRREAWWRRYWLALTFAGVGLVSSLGVGPLRRSLAGRGREAPPG